MDETLPSPWDIFLQLQVATDSLTVNARTNAREEALTDLTRAIALDPDCWSAYRHHGSVYANLL